MITSSQSKLSELLHQIQQTKHLFEIRTKRLEIDQGSMKSMHHEIMLKYGDMPEHAGLCAVHKALFKVHRKIAHEHASIIVYCNTLQSKIDEGKVSSDESKFELIKLREILIAMQLDFKLLEDQRKRILLEHNEFIKSLEQKKSK